MAKKKAANDEVVVGSFDDIDNLIGKVFEDIVDISKVDTKVSVFYDTGVYSLNYLMSRRLSGGVPKGRYSGNRL